MRSLITFAATCALTIIPAIVSGQTTLHLHKETNANGAYRLRTAGPDAAAFAIVSPDYKNSPAVYQTFVTFSTDAGSLGNGLLPANSTISVTLWMKKSTSFGVVFPWFFLRVTNGATLCATTTGQSALTTTLAPYTFNCLTQTDVVLVSAQLSGSAGGYFSQGPGSHSIMLELDVEGTLNGNYDSRMSVPQPQQGATITSVSQTSGIGGDAVMVSGSGFGSTQGNGGLTFNGRPATVTTWNDTSLGVTVPNGATTGDVIAWVNTQPSNSVTFTVFSPPTITAINPSGAPTGQTITVSGTNFGATQGTSTAALNGTPLTITSWANTAIAATIPIGATSGPVVVTVHSLVSNGFPFPVSPPAGPAVTYHLHKEASTTSGLFQLNSAGPDAASFAVQTIDLKNLVSDEFVTKQFDTQAGIPGLSGAIPIGSTISFTVWMKKTADFGVMLPRVRARLNNASGALLCETNGASGLTTTLTAYTLSCVFGSSFTIAASDRLYLWVGVLLTGNPGNHSVKAELDFEGVLNGNYDSRLTLPGTVTAPTLTSLSLSAASVGQFVTLTGSNFGTTQEFSAVTFNGTVAPVTSWSDTSVTVAVPAGATNGSVIITRLSGSNSLPFTVLGSVGGTIRTGGGSPVQGVTVQASQNGQLQGSATSNASGIFLVPNLTPGSYDVTASIAGFDAQSRVTNVSSGVQTTADFTLRASGVSYSYDSLNRLVSVTDGQGASARYNYDAVGNLLSIARYNAGSVTILSLSPPTGMAGAVVTIAGTGFAAQASQNTVQFNGISSTVLSSSTTALTVTVPSGATSGPVSVTTPTGSAISNTNFVVPASGSVQPSITSFSPSSGSAGTALTLNGTFDLVADILKLNTGFADVTSVTSATLGARIPSGIGSGRFTITTATGSALSADDFFVPPPFWTSNGYTFVTGARTSYGQPVTISVPNAFNGARFGLVLFDGVAGQRVAARATNVTGPVNCNGPNAGLVIYRTDNQIGAGSMSCNLSAPYTLPTSGTYAIGVAQADVATITIYEVHDKSATIGINQGSTPPLSVDSMGQTETWLFSGVAGQPISVRVTPAASGFSCLPSYVTILDPSGSQLSAYNLPCTSSPTYFTLPLTGSYTITVVQTYGDFNGSPAYASVSSP